MRSFVEVRISLYYGIKFNLLIILILMFFCFERVLDVFRVGGGVFIVVVFFLFLVVKKLLKKLELLLFFLGIEGLVV